MTLGYLMAPRVGAHHTPKETEARIQSAQDMGFSEFYEMPPGAPIGAPPLHQISLEHAQSLCVLPKHNAFPALKIVTIDGERQHTDTPNDMPRAVPAQTVQQVICNAHERRPTLSVSWLNKASLAQHWAAHVTACTHKAQRVQPENWKIARTIITCNDPTRASRAVFDPHSPCRAYYAKVAKSAGVDVDALMKDCVIHGTLAHVLHELQTLKETCGPYGTLTLVDHAWPDHEMARLSMAALATALARTPKRSWASR